MVALHCGNDTNVFRIYTLILGGNVRPESLKGGAVEIVGNLIGEAAHRFLGINPTTGKILGSIAGNVIFHMGGKDNNLGNIGKVVLDNIISGKFHRKVSCLNICLSSLQIFTKFVCSC